MDGAGASLVLRYIPWNEDNIYSKMAIDYRRMMLERGKKVAGKNVAVLHYTPLDGGDHLFLVTCSSQQGGFHSEKAVFDCLEERLREQGDEIAHLQGLYTERSPCGRGRGMKDCERYLLDRFRFPGDRVFNASGARLPVYYSFEYPSGGKSELDYIDYLCRKIGLDQVESEKNRNAKQRSYREMCQEYADLCRLDHRDITFRITRFEHDL
ncbi:conserved protein of unknown function [Rhodovastum atsumiense]|nr:conserved protein of unknown function [Rhodovastum atsumiense]